MSQPSQVRKEPRGFGLAPVLIGPNGWFVLKTEPDRVEALEEAVSAKWIHVEAVDRLLWGGDGLCGEIHGELVAFSGANRLEERLDLFGFQDHRQNPVQEAIVIENIREAGRDETAEALIQ